MDAVDGWDLELLQVAGHGFVGGQHELLDDSVRDVPGAPYHSHHLAEFVELDERLRQIEVDGAATHALPVEDERQFLHGLEARSHVRIFRAQCRIPFEDRVHLGVGHAVSASNDATNELLADDVAVMVDFEQRRQHQAIHTRFEGADVGGQLHGQHRHGAVREVDAGAPQGGLSVDGAARPDVVADVGDVNVQRETPVLQLVHPHGVVEIAGGFAVDGDNRHGAEIASRRQFLFGYGRGNGASLVEDRTREFVRDMMLADHDLDVHAEIIRIAENLDHAPHRIVATLWEFEDLDIHDHAVHVFRAGHRHRFCTYTIGVFVRFGDLHAGDDFDPLLDTIVERDHVVAPAAGAELAHHGGVRAFENAHDLAVSAAVRLDPQDPDDHAVTVHGLRCRIPGYEDVALYEFERPVGDEKPVAVAMHFQATHCVFAAQPGDDVVAGFCFDKVGAVNQAVQGAFELVALVALGF